MLLLNIIISDERECALEISEDEILANGLMKKNPKDRVEVTIGTGMDLTVHGKITNALNFFFTYGFI